MKIAIGFFAAIALLLIVVKMTQSATPQYAWVSKSSTVSLSPGAIRWQAITGDDRRIKVNVESYSSVSYGFTSTVFEEFLRAGRADVSLSCENVRVLSQESVCDIGPASIFVVKDDRGTAEVTANGIEALALHSAAAADRAIAPNKVTITISEWLCVANCPRPQ